MSARQTKESSTSTETVPSIDDAVLATLVTALLVRLGGKTVLTNEEWEQAIEHQGTLWVNRTTDVVQVVLMAPSRYE